MLIHKNLQRINWQRLAKQMPLETLTAEACQQIALGFVLNTFGDNIESKALRQTDYRASNGGVVGVGQYVSHESAVDLQLVNRQMLQV